MNPSRPKRTHVHAVRLTRGELAIVYARARRAGLPVSTYLRQRALAPRVRSRGSRLRQADVDQLARLGGDLNRFAHAANSVRRLVGGGELSGLLAEIRSSARALRANLPR